MKNKSYLAKRYEEYLSTNKEFPDIFNAYNARKIQGISPTILTTCGVAGSMNGVVIYGSLNESNKWGIREKRITSPTEIKQIKSMISLFSGIGAFEVALNRLGVVIDLKAYAEIDKWASTTYSTIHNVDESLNLGNVEEIDYGEYKNIDLITGGTPCQDFSIAGKGRGSHHTCLSCGAKFNPLFLDYQIRDTCPNCNSKDLEKTRSSLIVEFLRAVREVKPKYVVYENVKGLINKSFVEGFNVFKDELESYGYNVCYDVLNAKNYSIPQNRDRIFVVGIRKDIKKEFSFPEPVKQLYNMRDFLEPVVNTKYYINDWRIEELIKEDVINNDNKLHLKLILNQGKWKDRYESMKRVYNSSGITPTITTCQGGDREPKVYYDGAVRKITPREAWRFMGFSDRDYLKAKKALETKYYNGKDRSDSQMYKMAGNSIVVDVLEAIFKELFF